MPSFDAIVIGGGINGMAAAGKLALSGAKVTLLEASDQVGGMCKLAHLCHGLDDRMEKALKLSSHGLNWLSTDVSSTALSESGQHLTLHGAWGATVTGDLSPEDQQAWQSLRTELLKNANILAPFKSMTAPRLSRDHGAPVWKLLSHGLKMRGMGRQALREFMRLMLINVADVLDDELQDDRLKGLLAFDTVLGHYAGPRSPNSLLSLYNRISSNQGALALPRGGMASVAGMLQRALTAAGVTIKCGTPVYGIDVAETRATSVQLASGETMKADIIVSAIHPQTTFMSLVGAPNLDTGFVRRTQNIKCRGTTAHLRLTLNSKPDFRGADLRSRLVIAPSIRAVEDAFNAVKYGAFSEEPVMECVVATAFERPDDKSDTHVLTALVQFAPHKLRQGWAKGKPALQKCIMKQLERYAPGIGKQVVQSELLTPADVAKRYGCPGGQWHHAELSVEQMFFLRPAIGLAQYATPIDGLYLASAAMHPGGGVNGSAGWNAATQALTTAGAK